MGGAWERLIGSARRTLDSMLSKIHEGNLTHDVLATFMAEVSAIINNRPLVSVSTDATTPFILTPATLLTQKTPDACVARNLGEFTDKDLYKSEWKRGQALSDRFWTRWKGEYLSTLPAEQTEVDGRSPKFERRRCGAAPRQIRPQKIVAVSCDRRSPTKLRRSCPQRYYTPRERW